MAAAPKTVVTYGLDSSRRDFQIPFEYLARKFVQVSLIGKDRKVLILNIDYRFTQRTLITTTKAWGPTDGYEMLEIRRYTSATERLVDFSDGSILRAYDLNTSQVQSLHIAEEGRDIATDTIGVNNDGNLDARGRKIVNLADGVNDGDAVTVRQQKTWAESALNQANRSKTEADRSTAQADRAAQEATRSATRATASSNFADASEASNKASKVAADRADQTATQVGTQVAVAKGHADRADTAAANSKNSADASEASSKTSKGFSEQSKGSAEDSAASAIEANNAMVAVKYGTVPLFSMQWWGGKRTKIPAGYIPSDGQLLTRSLYPGLAEALADMVTTTEANWLNPAGTHRARWTLGDGSTTVRVPDFNGRSPGALGAMYLRGDGARTDMQAPVAIQMDVVREHSHTFIGPQRTFGQGGGQGGVGSILGTKDYTTETFTYATAMAGSGSETRPLTVTGCWIIKVFGAVTNSGEVDAMQIAGELALMDARVQQLEEARKPILAGAAIGRGHVNPGQAGPVNVHFTDIQQIQGMTYGGSSGGANPGDRYFFIQKPGWYRITFTGISIGTNTAAALRVLRGGVAQNLHVAFAATDRNALSLTFLGQFMVGDGLGIYAQSGAIYNPEGAPPYNFFTIERCIQ